ncbi:MAG: hypothetical protein WCS37_21160 [Chloroflexota bacterium]|nr:hypothetical protein [Chloroflexota bacterium]
MTRNESMTTKTTKTNHRVNELLCSNCGSSLEPVGNRLFLMYKRARLPQPSAEASVCAQCGWVEGDAQFQALLEERINHR